MATLEEGRLYRFGKRPTVGEHLRFLAAGEAGIAGVLVRMPNTSPASGYLVTWDGNIEATGGRVVGTMADLEPLEGRDDW
jgi:hypothetical protein